MDNRIAALLAAALCITACGADAGGQSGQGLSPSNADTLIVPRAGNGPDSEADAKPSKWSRAGASGAAMSMDRPADKAKPMGSAPDMDAG